MTVTSRQLPHWRSIVDVPVAAMGLGEASALVARTLADNGFLRINFLNANNANIAAVAPALADVLRRSVVLSDGAGLNMASRILYGAPFPANLNGTDFVPHLMRMLAPGTHVALIGGTQDVLMGAAAAISGLAPTLKVTPLASGYFGDDETAGVIAALTRLKPDILLVAMGTPRQELWADAHVGPEQCRVVITVGALFDFLARRVPRAPLVMRKLGIEWLFRLALEPKRLFRRYVIGNPAFVRRVLRQRARGRVEAAGLGRGASDTGARQ
ncbi:MAG: WecB/TagA/CpsF family glycosyltransferase [Rhizobiaceae bacterium]|jgi:exopolysaccharide biosynthesis WecB/TagA/CpsF family protein|nr:WecB/TagA/CpsF family glycosyltransferase [Rhizobiaceae bacterium]